jgi:hypothetical protein
VISPAQNIFSQNCISKQSKKSFSVVRTDFLFFCVPFELFPTTDCSTIFEAVVPSKDPSVMSGGSVEAQDLTLKKA